MPKRKGHGGGQIVLIDTPGVHKPDSSLGRKMMVEVREALEGCDLVLVIMDVTRKYDPRDQFALDLLKQSGTPAFLILNKVDRVREKARLLPLIEEYRKLYDFKEVIPISALKRNGLDVLLEKVISALPAGPAYFPEDQVTDQPERFLAAEIVREKAIQVMYHEVPYALAVIVEKFEETPKLLRIELTMHVERNSQKKILIGHKGGMLKKIGTEARKELETILGTRIYLGLFVKVVPDWRENPQKVRELDWRFQLEGLTGNRGDKE